MTTIHLQPESAHVASQSLKQASNNLAAHLQELGSTANRLDAAWEGGGKDAYNTGTESLLRKLNTSEEELAILIDRLQREIVEWEEVDRGGASGWQDWQQVTAWLNQQASLPTAAGPGSGAWQTAAVLPLVTVVAVSEFFTNLPSWLRDFLDKLFPPAHVISPIPDEETKTGPDAPVAPTEEQPAAPPAPETTAPPPEPEKKYDVLYDVPVKSQGDSYGSAACSPTSVSMVLDYFHNQDSNNKTISTNDLIKAMDTSDGTPGHGIALTNLTDELNDLGYKNISVKVDASMDDLKSQLASGPVIVTAGVKIVGPGSVTPGVPRAIPGPGNTIHAMVVKGINADTVVVNDPWSGSEMEIPTEIFQKMWSNGSAAYYSIRP
jgi:uncharacterized protein YukE/uncharacterized protein YvpB